MRRATWYPAVTGVAVAVSMAMRAAQGPVADPAAAVIRDAREALGGEEKLAAVKTLIATGRTKQLRGDNLAAIEFEIAMELPDKYVRRDEVPLQESGPTTVGFNGDALILVPPGGNGPARLATAKQDARRLLLGVLAQPSPAIGSSLKYVGKAEAPEGTAHVVDVTYADKTTLRLFVSADTHLPIMVSWQASAPGRRADTNTPAVESRVYYSDYRDVGGQRLPFRLRRAVGADTIEDTTFDRFRINARIDPKRFMPAR